MHGPYHGLSGFYYFGYPGKRYESLVNPVEVYYVGLPEFLQPGDVYSAVGGVDLEETLAAEFVGRQYGEPFAQEVELVLQTVVGLGNGDKSGFFAAYEHFGLYAVVSQCFAQPVGCYCRAAGAFRSVYE